MPFSKERSGKMIELSIVKNQPQHQHRHQQHEQGHNHQLPTSPTGASRRISCCYLSPITRRRSDMSTWPNLTTIWPNLTALSTTSTTWPNLTSTWPVSLFPLAARTVFCARCRNTQQEEDDRKSRTVREYLKAECHTWFKLDKSL